MQKQAILTDEITIGRYNRLFGIIFLYLFE
jgi:hypothetical protein